MNPQGEVFVRDVSTNRILKLGLDVKFIVEPSMVTDKPFSFSSDGKVVMLDDIRTGCLTVTSTGICYATDSNAGKVWLVNPDGSKSLLDEGLKQPTGIAISPDGLWLAVMESQTHWGYSYRVQKDGTVDMKQKFYWAHVPDWADESGAGNMCMDREGHPYVATNMGVQVFDRNGRSRGILPLPSGPATSVCFGGDDFKTLYATSGGKLYQRHMKAVGAPSFIEPIKLPKWGGG